MAIKTFEFAKFRYEVSDIASGIKTWIKTRDGWSMPREWISAASASVGHAELSKSRLWEGHSHLLLAEKLRRISV